MRKLFAIAVCVVIASLGVFLTGCGSSSGEYSDSQYVGTWEATTVEYQGTEMDITKVYKEGFTIQLNGDGSSTITANGEDPQAGTWEPVDGGVKLSGSDDLTMEGDENGLTLEYDGVTFNFEK